MVGNRLGRKMGPQFGVRDEVTKPGLAGGEEAAQLRRNELGLSLHCDSNRASLCNLGASLSDLRESKSNT